jgi:hypothetical protein
MTPWWTRNFFAARFPALSALMMLDAVRIGVAFAGLLTAAGGLSDLRDLWVHRLRGRTNDGSRVP